MQCGEAGRGGKAPTLDPTGPGDPRQCGTRAPINFPYRMIHGILELDTRGGGWVRRREAGYLRERNDVQVPAALARRFGLRAGDEIAGETGRSRGAPQLERLETINGVDPATIRERPEFSRLTATHPDEMLRLETSGKGGPIDYTSRVIDLICPFGKGQRAMIVAPAKAGKTMVLQAIAEGVKHNYPEAVLFMLLVDERPEEVFEIEAAGVGEVIASSFDHPPAEHVALAELTQERARRRVEMGQDVVLIVD